MKSHEEKFGEVPPLVDTRIYNQFIRKGESNQGKLALTLEQQEQFNRCYNKYLGEFDLKYSNQI